MAEVSLFASGSSNAGSSPLTPTTTSTTVSAINATRQTSDCNAAQNSLINELFDAKPTCAATAQGDESTSSQENISPPDAQYDAPALPPPSDDVAVHHVVDRSADSALARRVRQLELQQQVLMEQVRVLLAERQQYGAMARAGVCNAESAVAVSRESWPLAEVGRGQRTPWAATAVEASSPSASSSATQPPQLQEVSIRKAPSPPVPTLRLTPQRSAVAPSLRATPIFFATDAATCRWKEVSAGGGGGGILYSFSNGGLTSVPNVNGISSSSSSCCSNTNHAMRGAGAATVADQNSILGCPAGPQQHPAHPHSGSISCSTLGEGSLPAAPGCGARSTSTCRQRQAAHVTVLSPTHSAQSEAHASATAVQRDTGAADRDNNNSSGSNHSINISLPTVDSTAAATASPSAAVTAAPVLSRAATPAGVAGRAELNSTDPFSVTPPTLKASSPILTLSASSNALTDAPSGVATMILVPEPNPRSTTDVTLQHRVSAAPLPNAGHHQSQLTQQQQQQQQQSGVTPSSTSPDQPADGAVSRASRVHAGLNEQYHGVAVRRERERSTPGRASCGAFSDVAIRSAAARACDRTSFRRHRPPQEDALDALYAECVASTTSTISPASSHTTTALPEVQRTCSFSQGGSLVEEFRQRSSSSSSGSSSSGNQKNVSAETKEGGNQDAPQCIASFAAGMDQSKMISELFQDVLKVGHKQSLMENRLHRLMSSVVEQRDKRRRFQRSAVTGLRKLSARYERLRRQVTVLNNMLSDSERETRSDDNDEEGSTAMGESLSVFNSSCAPHSMSRNSSHHGSYRRACSSYSLSRSNSVPSPDDARHQQKQQQQQQQQQQRGSPCARETQHGLHLPQQLDDHDDNNGIEKRKVKGSVRSAAHNDRAAPPPPHGSSMQSGQADLAPASSLAFTPASDTVARMLASASRPLEAFSSTFGDAPPGILQARGEDRVVALPVVLDTCASCSLPSAVSLAESPSITGGAAATTTTRNTTATTLNSIRASRAMCSSTAAPPTTTASAFLLCPSATTADPSVSLSSLRPRHAHQPFIPSFALPSSVAAAAAAAGGRADNVWDWTSALLVNPSPSTPVDVQSNSAQQLRVIVERPAAADTDVAAGVTKTLDKDEAERLECVSASSPSTTTMTATISTAATPARERAGQGAGDDDDATTVDGASEGPGPTSAGPKEGEVEDALEESQQTQGKEGKRRGSRGVSTAARSPAKVSPLHLSRSFTASSSSSRRRRRLLHPKVGHVITNVSIPFATWGSQSRRPPLPPPIKPSPTLMASGACPSPASAAATSTAGAVVVTTSPTSVSARRSPSSVSSTSPTVQRRCSAPNTRSTLTTSATSVPKQEVATCTHESSPLLPSSSTAAAAAATPHSATTVSARRLYEALKSSKAVKGGGGGGGSGPAGQRCDVVTALTNQRADRHNTTTIMTTNSGSSSHAGSCATSPMSHLSAPTKGRRGGEARRTAGVSPLTPALTSAKRAASPSAVATTKTPDAPRPARVAQKPHIITAAAPAASTGASPTLSVHPRGASSSTSCATQRTQSPNCVRAAPVVLTSSVSITTPSTSARAVAATHTVAAAMNKVASEGGIAETGPHTTTTTASSSKHRTSLAAPAVHSPKATRKSTTASSATTTTSVAAASSSSAAVAPAVVAGRHPPRRGRRARSLRCREMTQGLTPSSTHVTRSSSSSSNSNSTSNRASGSSATVADVVFASLLTVSSTKLFDNEGRACEKAACQRSVYGVRETAVMAEGSRVASKTATDDAASAQADVAVTETPPRQDSDGGQDVRSATVVLTNSVAGHDSRCSNSNGGGSGSDRAANTRVTRPCTPPPPPQASTMATAAGAVSSLSRDRRSRAAPPPPPPPLSVATLSDASLSMLRSTSFLTMDENINNNNNENTSGVGVAVGAHDSPDRRDVPPRPHRRVSDKGGGGEGGSTTSTAAAAAACIQQQAKKRTVMTMPMMR